MLLLIVVVPPTVLRNVPALSKRLTPPLNASGAAFWAWNNAPARFVITALARKTLPAPVHNTVPPFSSTRVVRLTAPALLIVSVTPGGIIVRPLPLIAPPAHVIAPSTVTTWLPPNVP